jgi:hypothetical protein
MAPVATAGGGSLASGGPFDKESTPPRFFIEEIVFENLVVVKGELRGEVIFGKDPDVLGIILGLKGPTNGPGDKNGGDVVLSWVPPGIRIGMELLYKLHLKTCLLSGLPHRRLLEALAIITKSPGNGPLTGLIPAQDQNNPPIMFDDDVCGGKGVTVLFDRYTTLGTTKPFFFYHLFNYTLIGYTL